MSDNTAERLYKGSFSFYETTIKQLEKLAEQRRRQRDTDLQKEALHRGSLFIAIEGEPASDGSYGNLTVEQLAELIRPWVVLGMDWLERHGYPISPRSVSQEMAAFLNAVTRTSTVPPLGGAAGTGSGQLIVQREPEHGTEEKEAFIGGTILSSLHLEDSPML